VSGETTGADQRGKLRGANAGLVTPARPQACSERVDLGQHRDLKLFGKTGLQRDLEPRVRLDAVGTVAGSTREVVAQPDHRRREAGLRCFAIHGPRERRIARRTQPDGRP